MTYRLHDLLACLAARFISLSLSRRHIDRFRCCEESGILRLHQEYFGIHIFHADIFHQLGSHHSRNTVLQCSISMRAATNFDWLPSRSYRRMRRLLLIPAIQALLSSPDSNDSQ